MKTEGVTELDELTAQGPKPDVAFNADVALDEVSEVIRAQDGDLAAFEVLLDRYQDPLFRLALRIVKNRTTAEDALQDALISAWRRLPSLHEPAAFKTWIYRIVTYRCLDHLRRDAAHQTDLSLEQAETAGPGSTASQSWLDPAAMVQHGQMTHSLDRSLADLPLQLRVCWILKEVDDLSYAEIGHVLNLPASTVRGRLARARQDLAERMSSWR